MTSLLRLLQLCSQALPVGAYAYSSGTEAAVTRGWINDETSARDWIEGVFKDGYAQLDLPALLLADGLLASGDTEGLLQLSDYLAASRETRELLLEDVEMGRALQRLMGSLEIPVPEMSSPSFAIGFAAAGRHFDIELAELAHGFCFSWLENQVGVVTKTVPLGQTAAQQILGELILQVPEAVHEAEAIARAEARRPWQFGVSLPSLALLSCHHETEEARLYRS